MRTLKKLYRKIKGSPVKVKIPDISTFMSGDEIESIHITLNPSEDTKKIGDGIYYSENKKRIEINPVECRDIDAILRIYAKKGLIFEKTSPLVIDRMVMKIEDLYNFSPNPQIKKILEFYKDKIPHDDWEALRVAYLIREKFRRRKDISYLKRDLIKRYGYRGKNIANYCTAGYFDTFLKELYINSDPQTFARVYDAMIGRNIIAVFVHGDMEKEDIIEEVRVNLQKSKKYGVYFGFIHLHGIGRKNVRTIDQAINDPFITENFEINIFRKSENIIVVELIPK